MTTIPREGSGRTKELEEFIQRGKGGKGPKAGEIVSLRLRSVGKCQRCKEIGVACA